MFTQHPETNPYFGFGKSRNQVQEQTSGLATPQPQRGHGDQPQTQPPGVAQPQSQDQHTQPLPPRQTFPWEVPHRPDQSFWPPTPPTELRPPRQPVSWEMPHHPDQYIWPPTPRTEPRQPRKTKRPDQRDRHRHSERHNPLGPWGALAPERPDQSAAPQATEPTHVPRHPTQPQVTQAKHQGHRDGRVMPIPRKTTPIIWFLAGFCAIFWIVIILGGLIVLIVYLVFRPHSPSFDVSGVTLNSAYLDVDVLLNADFTVLAKFTNPNKKVKVDFSYVVLDLYYGNTMIASQYIEPFRAARLQTKLANVHMITSQVRLPLEETERLKREIERNAITFQVKGVFRARSSLGSFLHYSYRLYGHCTIVVTGPPTGVIKAVQCKTKR